MSAEDRETLVDPEVREEARKHAVPLIGIALSLGLAGLAFLVWLVLLVGDSDGPEGAETLIDGRTGDEVQVDEPTQ